MKKILILLVFTMIIVGCNTAVITPTVLPSDDGKTTTSESKPNNRPVYYAEGDTAVYVIAFSDKKEYKGFRKKFDELFKNYAFDTLKTDTVNEYFELILSGKAEVPKDDSIVDEGDSLIAEVLKDTLPKRYGKIKIYTAAGFSDEIFDLLTSTSFNYESVMAIVDSSIIIDSSNLDSLSINDADMAIPRLEIKQLTSRLYTVLIDSSIKTSDGVALSAFDLANSWNKILKESPAFGRALFKNVKGAKEIVMGTEAVVRGFKIRDKNRIDIQMATPDTLFKKQVSNPNIFASVSNTGTFAVMSDTKGVVSLKYNEFAKGGFALAEEYVLFQKLDKNPLISFSQKKYDVVPFFQKKDMQYAKKLERNGATIEELEEQVCFLILGSKSLSNRKYLKKLIDPARILTTAVMGEGEVYKKAVEQDDEEGIIDSESLKIIFRSDMPVQVKAAEKIFADLKQAGIKSELNSLDKKSYEKAIVGRKFDITVCSELKRVMTDSDQELFIAGKYLGSVQPIKVLIEQCKLFPLFSLKRWALCAENVKVFEKRVDGIYRIEPQAEQASIPPAE